MGEQAESAGLTKRDYIRVAPVLTLALAISWHSPGPSWMWVCSNRPCGAVTLTGPLLATAFSVLVFGVIYRYV